jgi:hypothetical protein
MRNSAGQKWWFSQERRDIARTEILVSMPNVVRPEAWRGCFELGRFRRAIFFHLHLGRNDPRISSVDRYGFEQ